MELCHLTEGTKRSAAVFAYLWVKFGVMLPRETAVLSCHSLGFRRDGFLLTMLRVSPR
jgi:hypothetical protein